MANNQHIEKAWAEYDAAYGKHAGRVRLMKKMDALYEFNHYDADLFGWDEPDDGEERYQSNAYTNVVDMSKAILSSGKLKWIVRGERETERSQKRASDIEQFIQGALYANTLRQQEDTVSKVLHDVLLRGWGVIRSGWNPKLEGEEEYEDEDGNVVKGTPEEFYEFPGVFKWIDPAHFFWQVGGVRPYRVQIYSWLRRADEVADEWGRSKVYQRSQGKDGPVYSIAETDDTLDQYIDLWYYKGGEVYNCVVWGGTLLKKPTKMPAYKDLPFTVLKCVSTSSIDIEHQSHSVIWPMFHAVQQSERMTNYLMRNIELHGDNIILAMDDVVVSKDAGGVTRVPPTYANVQSAVSYMPLPMSPVDIMRALSLFDKEKQEASFSSFSYAQAMPESGVAGQIMTSNDRVKLNNPRDNILIGLICAVQKLLDICAYYGETRKMHVFPQGADAVKLTGKQLKGWRVDATMKVELPNDLIRDVNVAATIKNAGLPYPNRYIQERLLGIDQPEEADKQLAREAIRSDQQLIQAAVAIAIEEEAPLLKEQMAQEKSPRDVMAGIPKPATGALPMGPSPAPPGNLGPEPVPSPPVLGGMAPPQMSPEGQLPLPAGLLPIGGRGNR